MQHADGLEIPESLEEACWPDGLALLVYDMQAGIVAHVRDREAFVGRVRAVLDAARRARVRVFFLRHLSLPNEVTGVFGLRTAIAWQRAERVEDVRSVFSRDSPGSQLIPEVAPLPTEAVFDYTLMSLQTDTATLVGILEAQA